MSISSRREHVKNLLGLAALSSLPMGVRAAVDPPVPAQGIGRRIRHVSYSDQGGRPDGVQVMVNRKHVYVAHMFSNGVTILDANDPRNLKPVGFFTGGGETRSHHLQIANDIALVVNGTNQVSAQTYRGYFESSLADINAKGKFRSGLSIHDVSKPAEMREIAFLEMPGLGVQRLWWTGGRYAYVSAHFDGFIDHILCIVDLQNITKPEIVSKWWLPGMNRAAGEANIVGPGQRIALHHMIVAGTKGYAAWRDGGFTTHDVSDPANPKLLGHINWSPPFPGGTHTPLPLPGRNLAIVVDEANAEACGKGTFYTWILDIRAPQNPVPIATMPTPAERDFCASPGVFGPHNLHENRPGSFQSEDIIFATYNNAGVRVFDIKNPFAPKEIASWVPPMPSKMMDPRPNVALSPKTADIFVMPDGLMFVSDWNAGMHVLQYEG